MSWKEFTDSFQPKDVVTALVALYGAGLATYNVVVNRKRFVPRVELQIDEKGDYPHQLFVHIFNDGTSAFSFQKVEIIDANGNRIEKLFEATDRHTANVSTKVEPGALHVVRSDKALWRIGTSVRVTLWKDKFVDADICDYSKNHRPEVNLRFWNYIKRLMPDGANLESPVISLVCQGLMNPFIVQLFVFGPHHGNQFAFNKPPYSLHGLKLLQMVESNPHIFKAIPNNNELVFWSEDVMKWGKDPDMNTVLKWEKIKPIELALPDSAAIDLNTPKPAVESLENPGQGSST